MTEADAEDERILAALPAREIVQPGGAPARRSWYWIPWAAALLVAAFLGWRWSVTDAGADTLLAQAYEEARPFEYRWPGARHVPIQQERGAGSAAPQALRKARVEIARHGEDPAFFRQRGQAELLGLEAEAAVESLRTALGKNPADAAARRALAIALAVAGSNDPARLREALELLRDDGSAEARFNRALLLERLGRREEAVAEWDALLRDEQDPGWRAEAERRRSGLR